MGRPLQVTMETVLAVFLLGGQNRSQGWKGRSPVQFSLSRPGLSSPALEVNKQLQRAMLWGGHQTGGGFEDLRGSFQAQSISNAQPPGQLRPRAAAFGSPVPSSVLTHLQHLEVGKLACMALSPLGLAAGFPSMQSHTQALCPAPPPAKGPSASSRGNQVSELPGAASRSVEKDRDPHSPCCLPGAPLSHVQNPRSPLNQSNHISI